MWVLTLGGEFVNLQQAYHIVLGEREGQQVIIAFFPAGQEVVLASYKTEIELSTYRRHLRHVMQAQDVLPPTPQYAPGSQEM